MISLGSLCSGYGGLELGVQAVLGGHTAWVSDVDPGACRILAHRFPGVPNIGDMTSVDWATVPTVDVLTGGTPCQDLSHAGKRAGMSAGTRSNLWVAMREAIAALRPRLIVWENVQGAYSAEADSDLGSNPRLLAGTRRRAGEPVLRALGRVLGDLDSLGYVGGWHGIRAADVGAPHGRLRVFVVARDSDVPRLEGWSAGGRPGKRTPRTSSVGALLPTPTGDDANNDTRDSGDFQSLTRTAARLFPSPRATDGTKGGPNQRGSSGDLMLPSAVVQLLPTPVATDAAGSARHTTRTGVAHSGTSLTDATRLLPTPVTPRPHDSNETAGRIRPVRAYGPELTSAGVLPPPGTDWGDYGPAVARWETLTRPAPEPTETGSKGRPRLSPRFSEWMMGLPDGWVTDVPGVTRTQALRAIGNGVVPQQAAAAVRILLDVIP